MEEFCRQYLGAYKDLEWQPEREYQRTSQGEMGRAMTSKKLESRLSVGSEMKVFEKSKIKVTCNHVNR